MVVCFGCLFSEEVENAVEVSEEEIQERSRSPARIHHSELGIAKGAQRVSNGGTKPSQSFLREREPFRCNRQSQTPIPEHLIKFAFLSVSFKKEEEDTQTPKFNKSALPLWNLEKNDLVSFGVGIRIRRLRWL